MDVSRSAIAGTSLFGDGAAALVVATDPNDEMTGFRVRGFQSLLVPDLLEL